MPLFQMKNLEKSEHQQSKKDDQIYAQEIKRETHHGVILILGIQPPFFYTLTVVTAPVIKSW